MANSSAPIVPPPAPQLDPSPLTEDELVELRSFIARHGIGPATHRIRIGRNTIANLAAGLNTRDGTRITYRLKRDAAKARGDF